MSVRSPIVGVVGRASLRFGPDMAEREGRGKDPALGRSSFAYRFTFLAFCLTLLTACGDDAACPPTQVPRADPDWCTGIYRSGGWVPIVAVISGAVLAVALTFFLVTRLRDRNRRFVVLAMVVYLMAGLVSVTIGNANIGVSLGDMASDPLSCLLQLLLWPVFALSYLSGNYGR